MNRENEEIIDFAEPFEAHVNVGRLRAVFDPEIPKEESLSWLYSAFEQITDYASDRNVL